MRKKFLFSALVLLFISSISYAKIRRVGYPGSKTTGTDYADLQTAHDDAAAKDTIMLYPGQWSANFSKKLVVIGPGYFLAGAGANTGLQNLTGTVSAYVNLSTGADSCVFEGIDGFQLSWNGNDVVNKVIVRRCNVNIGIAAGNVSDLQIAQCFLNNLYNSSYQGSLINLNITNCIINYIDIRQYNSTPNTGQMVNCSFFNSTTLGGSFLLTNNIFAYNHDLDNNCVYQYCIGTADYYPIPAGSGNQNISNNDMYYSVFVGYDTQGAFSNDGRYALKAGSVAIGAGVGGTNCGAFGGTNPYKLSGIPKIPAVYKLTAPSPSTSTNPYTITFSTRSNN